MSKTNCFCGSQVDFASCCQPYHKGKLAPNAQVLMRSRFSAYAVKNYQYIARTYAKGYGDDVDETSLAAHDQLTNWLSLDVLEHYEHGTTSLVEFKAYYKIHGQYYVMHERSSFIFEDSQWFYTNGRMMDGSGPFKPQRNSPCICGSGKKFKKCCGA
ncbi:YchJ family protein [Ningiella sp. W23]|uniref:YchJ family protein n=1 Tax=Ningiella sp. W23 TaxID=3023715 RepID=UPI00375634D2